MGLHFFNQIVQISQVLLDARLHERFYRCHEEVHDGFFRTTEAGAVAAGKVQVRVFVQQDGFQRPDFFFQIVNAVELLRRVGQIGPEVPFFAKTGYRVVGLFDDFQRVVVAYFHTFHTAFAGRGVDGDAEQAAAVGLFLFKNIEIRAGEGKFKLAQFLAEPLELACQRRAVSVGLPDGIFHRFVNQIVDGEFFGRVFELAANLALYLAHGLGQQFHFFVVLFHALHHGFQNIRQLAHQTRNGRVGAGGVAVAASRAVIGNPLRMLETNARHIAENGGNGRHYAQPDEGVGDVVVAHAALVEIAGLLPETVDVAQVRFALRHALQHGRYGLADLAVGFGFVAGAEYLFRHFIHLVEAATHHAHVVVHHAAAFGTKLVFQLVFDGFQQALFRQAGFLHQRRRSEKCALKRDALHAQLQFGVGGFLAGNFETVYVIQADVVVNDDFLVGFGNIGPDLRRCLAFALDDEHAAFFQTGQRVGVLQYVGVGREHHVHKEELAVHADGFGGRRQIVGGRLAFFLGAILGIGLDVVAQQVEQRHGQVLARSDGAPAAYRVETHRDGALRHEVGIFRTPHRQLFHMRICLLQRLLISALFGRVRHVADEVNGEVKHFFLLAFRQHILYGADDALRLQVAAAHAERTGVNSRHIGSAVAFQFGIRDATFGGSTVFEAFGEGGPHFSGDGRVNGQRLVQALQNGDAFSTFQHLGDEVGGERPEHDQIHHAYFNAAGFTQVVHHGFGAGYDAALPQNQIIGVLCAIAHHAGIAAPGELVVFFKSLIGQLLDVIEEVGPLRCHALHVGILVLHDTGHHGIVHVPHFGNAAAGGAVNEALRGSRRFDDVVGAAQKLADEFAFGYEQRLDEVRGQEAVLRDGARRERQLGNAVGDDVEVGHMLGFVGKQLEEARIVYGMVVVMAGVYVQGGFGHGPGADVEHIRQAFAHRGVQRFVHVRDALAGGEIGRPQPRHRQARRDGSRSVFAFGFDKNQRPVGDVEVPFGRLFRPILAHLRGGGDGIRARCIGGFPFAHNGRRVAVQCHPRAGIFKLFAFFHDRYFCRSTFR